jgi:hypothetical protein
MNLWHATSDENVFRRSAACARIGVSAVGSLFTEEAPPNVC